MWRILFHFNSTTIIKQTLLLLLAFIFTGLSAFADEDTRKDPELSFYSSSVGILAGTALEAPLRNPHGLMPIVYPHQTSPSARWMRVVR